MDNLPDAVQSQLHTQGIGGFAVSHVELESSNIRQFFLSRIQRFAERSPDAAILKMVPPALQRLATIPDTEVIYRWEAHSSVGKIVGYSTIDEFVAVFPWVMHDREWAASVFRF